MLYWLFNETQWLRIQDNDIETLMLQLFYNNNNHNVKILNKNKNMCFVQVRQR